MFNFRFARFPTPSAVWQMNRFIQTSPTAGIRWFVSGAAGPIPKDAYGRVPVGAIVDVYVSSYDPTSPTGNRLAGIVRAQLLRHVGDRGKNIAILQIQQVSPASAYSGYYGPTPAVGDLVWAD